jgi:hypothetical protein
MTKENECVHGYIHDARRGKRFPRHQVHGPPERLFEHPAGAKTYAEGESALNGNCVPTPRTTAARAGPL